MRFFSTVLAYATYVATAIAQTSQIAFTSVPAVVVAGSSYNITWGGGDGISVSQLRDAFYSLPVAFILTMYCLQPVTITLRKGDPTNLETVSTLTSKPTLMSHSISNTDVLGRRCQWLLLRMAGIQIPRNRQQLCTSDHSGPV